MGWFQTSPGFGFPKNKCDLELRPYLLSTDTRPALINDSDTAQGPQVWPGQLLLHRELSKSRLYRDNSSQDIYWLTWELSPFGNSASNNSPKAKALWRIWGLVLETRPQHSQLCFLGKEEVSSPVNKYLLRLLCLLTQISNSLNCIFDFQMWLYQVSKSQS